MFNPIYCPILFTGTEFCKHAVKNICGTMQVGSAGWKACAKYRNNMQWCGTGVEEGGMWLGHVTGWSWAEEVKGAWEADGIGGTGLHQILFPS